MKSIFLIILLSGSVLFCNAQQDTSLKYSAKKMNIHSINPPTAPAGASVDTVITTGLLLDSISGRLEPTGWIYRVEFYKVTLSQPSQADFDSKGEAVVKQKAVYDLYYLLPTSSDSTNKKTGKITFFNTGLLVITKDYIVDYNMGPALPPNPLPHIKIR